MGKIWLSVLVLCFNFHLVHGRNQEPLPHTTCERTWEKVGCFVDKVKPKLRTLPEQLVNDRDFSSDANDGHLIDWQKWEESMLSLACRCANTTRERGWNVFGLQFFGECWSGENGETTFNKYGEANPTKCIQELVGDPLPPCDVSKNMECIGAQSTNYIYRLKELKPKDVNGGYSMWSEWTQCSKSCGGGTKSRERTCTNPPPEGNGNGCELLGDPEEDAKCNEHACPDPCKRSLDVALIIDGSVSTGRDNFKKSLGFLSDLVGNLAVSPQGTHVGAIVFETTPTLHFNLAKSEYHTLSKLQAAIQTLPYRGGGTRTDKALELASSGIFNSAGGDRRDSANVAIVLVLGRTNSGSQPYNEVLKPLLNNGVRVVAVGVGQNIGSDELLEIAAGNRQYVRHVNDFDELKIGLSQILAESCQGAGDVDGGWSDWSEWTQCSKTCGGGIRVRERSCTNPPSKGNGKSCQGELEITAACSENPCPKPCTKALDVGIILDGSGSVGKRNFDTAKTFVETLMTHFTISKKASHMGMITYSTNARLEFDFAAEKYHDIVELKKRVTQTIYRGGWTRTDKALEMAAEELFTTAGGDRNKKPNILIVLTDGKTNRGSKPYPEVLQPLQKRGVRTVAVGIGDGINEAELLQIAMNDRQYVVQVDDFDALKNKLQMILDDSCQGAPPPPPSPKCNEGPLGLQNGEIPSDAITASSQWDENHSPDRARLNIAKSGMKRGAWSAKYNDLGQWLQVDFGKVVKITTVATQGRSDYSQWVTSYWLSYSLNNGYYKAYGENSPMIFTGNSDQNTVKENVLDVPIYSRYLRLHPKSWAHHISLRLEFYGCKTGFVPPSPPQCMDALGMQSGRIKPDAVVASSQLSSNHRPNNGRLHFQKEGQQAGAWSAKNNNRNQWIQVRFEVVAKVGRVAIQGRMDEDEWVKKYTLAYSFDGKVWKDYQLNGKTTVFQGNKDRFSVVTEVVNPPIVAQYIRVKPLKWQVHISMRVEFYGCTEDGDICQVHKPCKNGAQCTNVVGGYQCRCPLGFKGKSCDEDVDECAEKKPCKNGAKCTNTHGGYTCTCVGGWFTGKNCDEAPSECFSNVKLSSSDRASGVLRRYMLQCDRWNLPTVNQWHQFVGDAGTKMPTSCVPTQRCGTHAPGWMDGEHPKKEDGVVNRKVCFHWSGNCCRWKVYIDVRNCGGFYVYKLKKTPECYLRYCGDKGHNVCEPKNPCKNQGVCKPQNDGYYCQCKPGYQGKRCDKDVDECAGSNPCKNGGTCTNTQGSYKCKCDAKYTGANCETDVNECVVHKPCKNGATCVNAQSGYYCQCPTTYKGKHCDQDVDECAEKKPCKNGAKCTNTHGGYTCTCVGGWFTGKNCNEAPSECFSNVKLSSSDRASGVLRSNILQCDKRDLPTVNQWHQFVGDAGTKMPTSCVPTQRCGTHAPGWMDGEHPKKEDGVVSRKVCFHWSGNCCRWKVYIDVRNCGGFYVYKLKKTPECYLRYCGDKGHNVCEPKNPCKNQGVCKSQNDGYYCQCKPGYQGKRCDKDVDECAGSNPCKNGGTCTNTQGSYKCKCDAKYTGANCETDVNECVVHKPCKNGATCVNAQSGYYCQCPTTYKGKHCDQDVDECAEKKPCKNGAKCTNTHGGYTCTCVGGWFTGKNCNEAPSECFSNVKLSSSDRASGVLRSNILQCDKRDLPTVNQWHQFVGDAGTKMPTSCVPTQRCGTHAPGWMDGEHPKKEDGVVSRKVCFHWSGNCCRWKVYIDVRNCGGFYVYKLKKTPECYLRYCGDKGHNVCEPKNPCKNQGVCKPQNDGYYCQCKPGYQGKRCDKDVDECAGSNPCKNGGTCINTQGSYKCKCDAKYTGADCETDVNECVVHKPCKNGATCVNAQGGYHCQCTSTYKGKHCDQDVDECAPQNPCQNGGRCINTRGGYTCSCPRGFTGKNCDQVVIPTECKNYITISENTRSTSYQGGPVECDRRKLPTVGKWHRFMGAAGTTMPTSCVPTNRCGTHAPGWLQGRHPSEDEGVVTRKVCFHWSGRCCKWSTNIRVRNCGDFYVYKLPKTPQCNLRYCAESGDPEAPSECKRAMDIGVIMDRSGSVGGKNFNEAKNFVISLVHKLQISSHGTRIGIIPYYSHAHVFVRFADTAYQTPAAIANLINRIRYTAGGTRTDKAIDLANKELFTISGGDRSDKSNVLIVMTDGKTNHGSVAYNKVLAPLLRKHVRMVAVGVGSAVNEDELLEIANGKRENVIHVDRFDELDSNENNVLFASCHPDSPPPPCQHAMDVGIIMDRSGSVGSADFRKSKRFVISLVHKLQISSRGTRIGIIPYQSFASVAVTFGQEGAQNPSEMTKIINNIAYRGGGTRTDYALDKANSALFSSAGGDRKDKPNILVVITDGDTNNGSRPYKTVLAPLLQKHVKMIAVGVGWKIDYSELEEIANGKSENVFHVDKFEDLFVRLNSVLKASCAQ